MKKPAMTPKLIGGWFAAALALAPQVALAAAPAAPPAPAPPAKPNIVIFIADDLTWHDVACFGGPTGAKTPNLDRLASQGVKLTGFFSSAAVCSPTRQALLTGLYPVRNGAYPNHSQVKPGTRSLPFHLKELGYRSARVGKSHFGPPASFPFDEILPDKPAAMKRFMRAEAGRPFCLYIASNEPHGPWTKGDKSAYGDPAALELPPYLIDTPETRRDLPAYYAEVTEMDRQVGEVMELLAASGREQDTLMMFFSEQGHAVPSGKWTCYDPGIRVAAIARWPGHIPPGSQNPALVQYVDVLPTLVAAAGGDPAQLDAGCPDANGGRGLDGRSFLAVLSGKTTRHRDCVFSQHTARGIINGPAAYGTRAVRDARWKLIVNLHPEEEFSNIISQGPLLESWRAKGRAGDALAGKLAARYTRRPALELYDLQNDPWELTDVAGQAEHAATLTRLRGELDAWMKQQGDLGDVTERAAHTRQPGKR